MTRVLVITGDPIGARMAGPAIRSWNIARVLGAEHEVTLMTTTRLEPVDAPFRLELVEPGQDAAFAALHDWAEVIVFQGYALDQFPVLRSTQKVLVADIYDPLHLEMLEQGRELARATWNLRVSTATRVLNDQLALADFFVCASERQRMFYLGQLAALGRLTPDAYEHDPHLRRLIDVVPFGLEAQPPARDRPALRGVLPGIDGESKLLIWGGGVYSWFDPLTLIRAVAELARRRPQTRLFFLGTRHPGVEEMGIVRQSLELARELGSLDRSVFFNEDWVGYAERGGFLAEADAGVSTHHSHVETTFSFRTRMLDYLWAGLPMVTTEGDTFAELTEREGLGLVVPAEDVAALGEALERVLYDEEFAATVRQNVARVREEFVWERVLEPLAAFVRAPARAADHAAGRSAPVAGRHRKSHGRRHSIRMFWHYLRAEGLGSALRRVRKRLRGR